MKIYICPNLGCRLTADPRRFTNTGEGGLPRTPRCVGHHKLGFHDPVEFQEVSVHDEDAIRFAVACSYGDMQHESPQSERDEAANSVIARLNR
jgi:hypothetical protein